MSPVGPSLRRLPLGPLVLDLTGKTHETATGWARREGTT